MLYLNRPIEEITKQYFFDIFPISENQIEIISEIIQNAFDYDLSEITEIDFVNKNNNISWVELFFSSVKLGNEKYIQVVMQDISRTNSEKGIYRK